MRKTLTLLLAMAFMTMTAQDEFQIVRGDCMPAGYSIADGGNAPLKAPRRLPAINTEWDASRTYRQLVILVSFSDTDFNVENPQEYYNDMLNTPGFNDRMGPGCMADYFRVQSGGLFNIQFDVYGPYKVSTVAQPYANPTSSTKNYGSAAFTEATNMFIAAHPDTDFSVYDWNDNGYVNQVIYVFAGVPGNLGSTTYGHIWPNTSSFTTINTPDGKKISNYTASGEHWPTASKTSCGFGTICHEFAHSLGLPDIYPTSGSAGYSVCDEWDLMDGGNFTNYGWCPPNFTPMEKYLLGWLQFEELTSPTTITGLKPAEEGGAVYRIKHTDTEWLLLENRQQTGWDLGAPGSGLVIYHVDYNPTTWSNNEVNNNVAKRGFELVHADNMDYDAWDDYAKAINVNYANSGRLNRMYLSTSPYPWSTDSTTFINDALTDTTVPAAQMNNANAESSTLLGLPITNITVSNEGLVSFTFMNGNATLAGDVNADGQVGIADIVAVTNFMAGTASSSVTLEKADVNNDGEVGIADIVAITNIMAGQ